MLNYQKKPDQIATAPVPREKLTDRHPGPDALDPLHGKRATKNITVQRERLKERAIYRSAEEKVVNRASLTPNLLLRLQHACGNQFIARMIQKSDIGDSQSGVSLSTENAIERIRGKGKPLESESSRNMGEIVNVDFRTVSLQKQATKEREDEEMVQTKSGMPSVLRQADEKIEEDETGHLMLARNSIHRLIAKDGNVIRRATTVPAPFLGGSPFNDSAVTFTPHGKMFVGGALTSSTDFSESTTGRVQIVAGSSGVAQIYMSVHGFEDNMLINQSWDQNFYVNWEVSAARDGTLTIGGTATPNVLSRTSSGDSFGTLSDINPSNGNDYVQVSPKIVSGGSSGGISLGVGMQSNFPGSFIQRSFRLNIEVTGIEQPTPTTHTTAVTFGVGSDEVSAADETFIVGWYTGLPADLRSSVEAGETQIIVRGYASTTQPGPANRDLARRRAQHVRQILLDTAGTDARFNLYSHGEYTASTPDETEDPLERRVQISTTYTPAR